MAERKLLRASDEEHILTNGTVYGTEIWLAEGVNGEDFREITLDEYNAMLESEDATEEDYIDALREMGVDV
jgi:hypothetical protein